MAEVSCHSAGLPGPLGLMSLLQKERYRCARTAACEKHVKVPYSSTRDSVWFSVGWLADAALGLGPNDERRRDGSLRSDCLRGLLTALDHQISDDGSGRENHTTSVSRPSGLRHNDITTQYANYLRSAFR